MDEEPLIAQIGFSAASITWPPLAYLNILRVLDFAIFFQIYPIDTFCMVSAVTAEIPHASGTIPAVALIYPFKDVVEKHVFLLM
jgi:hypothetical protein